jgi:hypothetical protein
VRDNAIGKKCEAGFSILAGANYKVEGHFLGWGGFIKYLM